MVENQFLIKGIAEFIPLKNAQTYGEEKNLFIEVRSMKQKERNICCLFSNMLLI